MALPWVDPPNFTAGVMVPEQSLDQLSSDLNCTAHIEDVETGVVNVTSTTTETDLFSYDVPAGRLSTNRELRVDVRAGLIYNTAATLTMRLRFGSAVISLAQSDTDFSSTVEAVRISGVVSALGTNASQYGELSWQGDETGVRPLRYSRVAGSDPTWTVDSTIVQTLRITAQWSAASANLTLRRYFAVGVLTGS